jgi:predicted amidohydrolase YtcJ
MLPGLIDSHTHIGPCALAARYEVDGRCPPNRSVNDILERIGARVKTTPKGEWIVARLSMFADQKLAEKRYPTRTELDRVAPEHPLLLKCSAHAQLVNTFALRKANIKAQTPDPPGAKIERDKETLEFPLRSMLDSGLSVTNCSDCYGTAPISVNPFWGIWAAVTRQTFFGNSLIPEEAISVKEALRLYTTHAAYSGFEEEQKGAIEPGRCADVIVIDRDILSIPEDEIKDIKVLMSIIDGNIVYQQ